MKFFKAFPLNQKLFVVASGLLASTIFCCSSNEGQEEVFASYNETAYTENEQGVFASSSFTQQNPETIKPTATPTNGGEKKVVLYDQGLQMPMSSMLIPTDWKLDQDIAIDPNTGKPVRYKCEITGTHGEMMRSYSDMFFYGAANGKSFENAYHEALQRVFQGNIQQVNMGQLQRDTEAEAFPQGQKMMQRSASKGQQMSLWKVQFTATQNGKPIKGSISIGNLIQESAYGQMGIVWPAGLLTAPVERYEATEEISKKIAESIQANPAYEQRREQISQMVIQRQGVRDQQRMANSQAAHQQRMQMNQNAFEQSQNNIMEMNRIRDANHQQFIGNLRNSNNAAWNNNEYGSHEALVDQIHGRQTFDDPSSGFNKSLDGQYNYNFTDGLGNYYRTNDANFDYNSLPGNWRPINPQSPKY